MKRRNFLKSGGMGLTGLGLTTSVLSMAKGNMPLPVNYLPVEDDDLVLNFHLMHPGGLSAPGDPNAAFFLNNTCHLHYILRHPWKDAQSFSFIHVSFQKSLEACLERYKKGQWGENGYCFINATVYWYQ